MAGQPTPRNEPPLRNKTSVQSLTAYTVNPFLAASCTSDDTFVSVLVMALFGPPLRHRHDPP